eukprot:SAG11_NODE_1425_length_4944_cov_3.856966_2_plen_324_part_00
MLELAHGLRVLKERHTRLTSQYATLSAQHSAERQLSSLLRSALCEARVALADANARAPEPGRGGGGGGTGAGVGGRIGIGNPSAIIVDRSPPEPWTLAAEAAAQGSASRRQLERQRDERDAAVEMLIAQKAALQDKASQLENDRRTAEAELCHRSHEDLIGEAQQTEDAEAVVCKLGAAQVAHVRGEARLRQQVVAQVAQGALLAAAEHARDGAQQRATASEVRWDDVALQQGESVNWHRTHRLDAPRPPPSSPLNFHRAGNTEGPRSPMDERGGEVAATEVAEAAAWRMEAADRAVMHALTSAHKTRTTAAGIAATTTSSRP